MNSKAEEMRSGYRAEFDSGDPWGSVMKWRFDICAELSRRGANIPASWEYRDGAGGPPDPEDGDADLSGVPDADLVEFGEELAIEADRLEAEGRSY